MAQQADDELVLVDNHGPVRLLTLNRPDRLNAINTALLAALLTALQAAAADDSVHVTVLTGAGRAFCSGADLSDMAQGNAGEHRASNPAKALFDDLQSLLETFPKPLVGAVNGLGIGFGFTVLGYCDFAFLARGARLRTPFGQLGLSPEASSSYLFPLRMGWGAAARALMLGDWMLAEDLVACGIAQEAVDDDRLLSTALAFAARLAAIPLQSLVATKALMLAAHLPAMRAARAAEAEAMARLIGSPANIAAVEAFAARKGADSSRKG